MDQVLIYSDSLSWGIVPGTRKRLGFEHRWGGVFENTLNNSGQKVRVIENCLNGRRTVWGDPFKPGRNGAEFLAQSVEMHSPLALIIIMLGTNDFQCTHENNAWLSAQGVATLIKIVREAQIEPGMPIPPILVISPPRIHQAKGAIANKFLGAEKRCAGFSEALREMATAQDVSFFCANSVVSSSVVDGIHLDEPDHNVLGRALAEWVMTENLLKPR
ncbi:GDSL family lipase [Gammaproteobacteria bacterium 45_16_T64]|nr:GDSL family lipase [Gammaproteobacteria bacterium 45_16_T64]